jgi:hypothetical protein
VVQSLKQKKLEAGDLFDNNKFQNHSIYNDIIDILQVGETEDEQPRDLLLDGEEDSLDSRNEESCPVIKGLTKEEVMNQTSFNLKNIMQFNSAYKLNREEKKSQSKRVRPLSIEELIEN